MFSRFSHPFLGKDSHSAKKRAPQHCRQLRIENLEDRRLLSVSTVGQLADENLWWDEVALPPVTQSTAAANLEDANLVQSSSIAYDDALSADSLVITPMAISNTWGTVTAFKKETQHFSGSGKRSGSFTFTLAHDGDANSYIELNDGKSGDQDDFNNSSTYLEIRDLSGNIVIPKEADEVVKISLKGLAAGTYRVNWQFDVKWWFASCDGVITINPPVAPPIINAHPVSATYEQGQVATPLSVSATTNGYPGSLSYQWQRSTNNSSWTNLTGQTSTTYILPTSSVGTIYYRCVVTNTRDGYTTPAVASNSARIDVIATPTITQQPVSATYLQGETATALTVMATKAGSDPGVLSYQWQSNATGDSWSNIAGQTSTTYTPPTNNTGMVYYRCVVTNRLNGKEVHISSSGPSVYVIGTPSITAQPEPITYLQGETAKGLIVTAAKASNDPGTLLSQ